MDPDVVATWTVRPRTADVVGPPPCHYVQAEREAELYARVGMAIVFVYPTVAGTGAVLDAAEVAGRDSVGSIGNLVP